MKQNNQTTPYPEGTVVTLGKVDGHKELYSKQGLILRSPKTIHGTTGYLILYPVNV